jgi:hypothetical protein
MDTSISPCITRTSNNNNNNNNNNNDDSNNNNNNNNSSSSSNNNNRELGMKWERRPDSNDDFRGRRDHIETTCAWMRQYCSTQSCGTSH